MLRIMKGSKKCITGTLMHKLFALCMKCIISKSTIIILTCRMVSFRFSIIDYKSLIYVGDPRPITVSRPVKATRDSHLFNFYDK